MAGFAFIFAPAAFAHVGPTAAFAATIAASIRGLTFFGFGCAAVLVLASLAEFRRLWWLAAIAVVMCALSWYEVQVVVPLMERTPLQTPAYEALHHRSSAVYSAVLLLGLLGLGIATLSNPSHSAKR